MDAPPRPPQPLALQGPRKIVNLPVWAGPERTTDCTILGRKPVAGIRTTALGLGDDKRISREHAILLCDTHTGRWSVENLKANPIYVQRGFATNGAVEGELLCAGGPAAELAVGDAICFALVDESHRVLVVPRKECPQQKRVAGVDTAAAPATKRARAGAAAVSPGSPGARNAAAAAAAAVSSGARNAVLTPQPVSAIGDTTTPIMPAVSVAVEPSQPVAPPQASRAALPRAASPCAASPRAASSAVSPQVPRAAFARHAVTFVDRGMREKQLAVFKKQLQDGGGRFSVNQLMVDSEGKVCTTHIVANSWRRAAEAVGEATVSPSGLPVANADWMVQAIKDSKSGRDICPVDTRGKYRLLPEETDASGGVGSDIGWEQVEKQGGQSGERARVPYSEGNHLGSRYEPPPDRGDRNDHDSQQHERSADEAGQEAPAGVGAAESHESEAVEEMERDKVPLLIELFEELKDLTEADEAKNNHWRVRNYQKMVNCLKKYHACGWPPLVRSGDFMRTIEDIKEDRMPGCPLFVSQSHSNWLLLLSSGTSTVLPYHYLSSYPRCIRRQSHIPTQPSLPARLAAGAKPGWLICCRGRCSFGGRSRS